MTAKELRAHQKKMLQFCLKKNLAIDDLIARIECYIAGGEYDSQGSKVAAEYHAARGARLLTEALSAIKKLTGK